MLRRLPLIDRLTAVILAVALMVGNLAWSLAVTPAGTHCPTAAVQVISVAKSCCSTPTTRNPQPGDPEFKQCRCAEKKAADNQKHETATRAPELPPADLCQAQQVLSEPMPPIRSTYLPLLCDRPTRTPSPPNPPPDQI